MTRFGIVTLCAASVQASAAYDDETGLLQVREVEEFESLNEFEESSEANATQQWGWFRDLFDSRRRTPPPPPPPPPPRPTLMVFKSNAKCPYNNGDRLFRKTGVATEIACRQECENSYGCKFYSYQMYGTHGTVDGAGNYDGVCMGCTREESSEHHAGFNLYPVNYDVCNEQLVGDRESGYRGCQDHAINGEKCQKWTAQSPNQHTRTPRQYPNYGLDDHNFCRNPDGEPNIWCYTQTVRWTLCAPKTYSCDETHPGGDGRGYRGCQSITRKGKTCQFWTAQRPHVHSRESVNYPNFGVGHHNYCRNPDGEPDIWCYTLDHDTRWDFCDTVQACDAQQHCSGHGQAHGNNVAAGCACTCTDGYGGDDCSIPPTCLSNVHCNGHATLDKDATDGCVCHCANGWSGDSCDVPPPCDSAADCSNHGTTTDQDKTDGCACSCTGGFSGSDCSMPPPCQGTKHCSGHGKTEDLDASDGCSCSCFGGFMGDDCSVPPACSSEEHCNGHVTLDKDSTDGCVCHCADGWSGASCNVPPACDSATDCSGHGKTEDMDKTNGCDCKCAEDFTGNDCSVPPIPKKVCCRAMTLDCLSCSADMSAAEYCKLNPATDGCEQHLPPKPRVCCQAMTKQCLACKADLTEEEYCKIFPHVEVCEKAKDKPDVPCDEDKLPSDED